MPKINHNVPSMITASALRNVNRQMQKSLEKLSTGLRINRASDDASGLSVSESLRTQYRGLHKANANALDGIALLQIAEGAENEISAMLQRMRELAVQADNDTLTTTERTYLNIEFKALQDEIDRIASSTQYNRQHLVDGTGFGMSGGTSSILHLGANNVQTVDRLAITIDGVSCQALGISSSATTDDCRIISGSYAFAAISSIDAAIDSINAYRSSLGSMLNRLEHTVINIENQAANMVSAESTIRDTDFAEETTEFVKNQILTQSATAMLAQANTLPQSILSLLQ
ncbi:MAG: flagellin [Elusimicrobiota bacterium]